MTQNCLSCTIAITQFNVMPRSELLFQLSGEKFKEFNQVWRSFPLCVDCGRRLMRQPKLALAYILPAQRRPRVEIFWCDNCFISMRKSGDSYRYFGDKQFCNFCSASNHTRYSHYLRIAAFFERQPDPESLLYFRPTHRKTCDVCRIDISVGGAYHERKFYCLRHAPASMGIPPIRVIERLHYPELAQ